MVTSRFAHYILVRNFCNVTQNEYRSLFCLQFTELVVCYTLPTLPLKRRVIFIPKKKRVKVDVAFCSAATLIVSRCFRKPLMSTVYKTRSLELVENWLSVGPWQICYCRTYFAVAICSEAVPYP